MTRQDAFPINAVSSSLSSSGSLHPSRTPVIETHSETASSCDSQTLRMSQLTYRSNFGRLNLLCNSEKVSSEKISAPFTDRTESRTARGDPRGRSAALIRTLVSTTTRLLIIRQEGREPRFRQTVCRSLLAQGVHCRQKTLPCGATKALVVLYRHHHADRTTLLGHLHGCTLGSVEQLTESIFSFSGSDLFHVGHNSYNGPLMQSSVTSLRHAIHRLSEDSHLD